MTKEKINLKDYFIHHYDDWGRLYCVEFKGSPLELENSIKYLEQENKELEKEVKQIVSDFIKKEDCVRELKQENNLLKQTLKDKNFVAIVEENKKLLQTLQEIKTLAEKEIYMKQNSSMNKILDLITKAEEE